MSKKEKEEWIDMLFTMDSIMYIVSKDTWIEVIKNKGIIS